MDHAGADHGVGPDAGHGIDHDADPDAGHGADPDVGHDAGRNAVHDGGHDNDRVVGGGGGGGGLELGEQSHDTQSAVAQVGRWENHAENHGAHGAHGAVDAGLDAGLGVQNATGVVQVSAKAGVVADRRKQGVDRAKARRREHGS